MGVNLNTCMRKNRLHTGEDLGSNPEQFVRTGLCLSNHILSNEFWVNWREKNNEPELGLVLESK